MMNEPRPSARISYCKRRMRRAWELPPSSYPKVPPPNPKLLLSARTHYPKLPLSSPEHDQLFYLVYECVQVAEGSLDPHLWAYRSRITLEHLRQNLQQQNMKKKCPILHAFLQEVCVCNFSAGGLHERIHFVEYKTPFLALKFDHPARLSPKAPLS